jgi:EmrB/QacA subfamily drug resistance transporter
VAIFAVWSAWCGLSRSVAELVIARAAQGVGAALLVPGSLAIISASFPPDARGRAIGTWSGFTAITTAVGPVLGGWLIEHSSWRWVFFINAPVALAVIAISLWRVPETHGTESARHFDWTGVVLGAAGLASLVYSLIASATLAGLAAVVLLAAFLLVESRTARPMLPLALFRSTTFTGANLLTLLLYSALGGVMFFLPLNLIQVQGYSATQAGAAFLPFIGLMFGLSRWSGGLVARFGSMRPLTIGPLIAAVGFALFMRPGIGGSYWTTVFPAIVMLGLGMTVSVSPLTTTVMNAVDEPHAGTASGVNNAVSRVAGALAIAVFGAVLSASFNRSLDRELQAMHATTAVREGLESQRSRLAAADTADPAARDAVQHAFITGYRAALGLAAGLAVAAALTAAWLIRDERRTG